MTYKIICKIKNFRRDLDLTQEELSSKLGISRQSLISLEQGKSLPSLNLAFDISQFFNKAIEELFSDIDNKLTNSLPGANMEVKMPRQIIPWRGFGGLFDDDSIERESSLDFPTKISSLIPAIDVYDEGAKLILEAQIPGIKIEDIKVEAADDHVVLSGERKQKIEEKEKKYYLKEVNYGSFSRVIPLPTKVNPDKISASLNDGLLKLVLPKSEEKQRKEIKIINNKK